MRLPIPSHTPPQARLKVVERELKTLAAQQKALAAQKQVRCARCARRQVACHALAVVCRRLRFDAFLVCWLPSTGRHSSGVTLPTFSCDEQESMLFSSSFNSPPQELADERVTAQRKKAGAELDVADLEEKLRGNQGAKYPGLHLGWEPRGRSQPLQGSRQGWSRLCCCTAAGKGRGWAGTVGLCGFRQSTKAAMHHSTTSPAGTRQRCEADLAKLDKQIGRKERELEGVNRQLAEATARQGGWCGRELGGVGWQDGGIEGRWAQGWPEARWIDACIAAASCTAPTNKGLFPTQSLPRRPAGG